VVEKTSETMCADAEEEWALVAMPHGYRLIGSNETGRSFSSIPGP
jgi:hypothetical protein